MSKLYHMSVDPCRVKSRSLLSLLRVGSNILRGKPSVARWDELLHIPTC